MIDPVNNLAPYPGLENLFNSLDSSIKGELSFEVIQHQLSWAFNDYEQKRAIHRLHCVLKAIISKSVPYFEKLSSNEKQALIVLTVLDGCKNSQESLDLYSLEGYTPLKDGVPSLFDMLANSPEIFPLYRQLGTNSKEAIKNHFFYLHLRHLQLGEVPLASVPETVLTRPRHLMVAFWYANAMGFNINNNHYPFREETLATITDNQKIQFANLLEALENKNLTDFYAKNSIFDGTNMLNSSFAENEIEYICRLGKMLSFIGVDEKAEGYHAFVRENSDLIKEVARLEADTYSKHKIEAFTFLPAVLKALKDRAMPSEPVSKILRTFLSLQKQLFLSVPSMIKDLGRNRTIPLFHLSSNQDEMLKRFSSSSEQDQYHFKASMNDFITISLVDGPVSQIRFNNLPDIREKLMKVMAESKLNRLVMLKILFALLITDILYVETWSSPDYADRDPDSMSSLLVFNLFKLSFLPMMDTIHFYNSCSTHLENMQKMNPDEELTESDQNLITKADNHNFWACNYETAFSIVKPLIFTYSVVRLGECISPEAAGAYAAGFIMSDAFVSAKKPARLK